MGDAGHHHRIGGWDVHTHIVPPAMIAAAERGRFGMQATPPTLRICGHGVPLHPISDVGKLVDRIHADGLDGAIVSVPPPLFRPDLGQSDRREYAALVNDGLREACQGHSSLLRPLAYLPAEDPEVACGIATQLDTGWVGVVMGTELGTLSYASGRFDPLWDTLGRLSLPLFIHPGSTPDQRLEPFYLTNLLGNPAETTIAAANLVFAGVMHRFPALKIILAHGGGCVAALCGRWQRGATTNRPGIPELDMKPAEAVRKFYVDSLVHSPAFLAAIAEIVGEDRILLGSDWPFPMGAPSADHDLGALDAALKHKIRKANAEAAFGSRLHIM
ncbi:MAG: amidohydrolase family protein [Pseudorhodoplanes sp.]